MEALAKLGFHIPSLLAYLVNFIVLLTILYFVGYKRILAMLDQRSERIRESTEMVERVRQEAAAQQEDMERRLDEGRREGQALLNQAREMADRYREEERERARQEAEAFVARARDDIQRERDEAVEQVRRHFADLAILAAERVIERSLDESAHRDIIEKVLEESPTVDGR